jgi:thiol-disulfide isomerase/thioredoxin
MKKLTLLLLAAVIAPLSLSACSRSEEIDVPEDAQFPEFVFPYEFEAIDLFGNAANPETLGEYRAFFVYHWATWCGPCVRSMPTLAELAREYGDDVAFIGLLGDFANNPDNARRILESANMPDNFIVINAAEPSVSALVDAIQTGVYPTSAILTANDYFPDSIRGAISERHRNILDEIVSERD